MEQKPNISASFPIEINLMPTGLSCVLYSEFAILAGPICQFGTVQQYVMPLDFSHRRFRQLEKALAPSHRHHLSMSYRRPPLHATFAHVQSSNQRVLPCHHGHLRSCWFGTVTTFTASSEATEQVVWKRVLSQTSTQGLKVKVFFTAGGSPAHMPQMRGLWPCDTHFEVYLPTNPNKRSSLSPLLFLLTLLLSCVIGVLAISLMAFEDFTISKTCVGRLLAYRREP